MVKTYEIGRIKLMDLARHINIIDAVIVWLAVFIIVKPKRAKELLPVAVLSMLVLFGIEMFVQALELTKFNNPFLPVAGIPLFHLLWGAGSGIIFVYFMKKEFIKKAFIIFVFTFIAGIFGYISEKIGNHSHMGNIHDTYNYILDYLTLVFLIWAAEGLFMKSIYPNAVEM